MTPRRVFTKSWSLLREAERSIPGGFPLAGRPLTLLAARRLSKAERRLQLLETALLVVLEEGAARLSPSPSTRRARSLPRAARTPPWFGAVALHTTLRPTIEPR